MRRVLYVDPWGGLAGDMLIAALLDLERPRTVDTEGEGVLPGRQGSLEEALRLAVDSLALGDVRIDVDRVRSGSILATRVSVYEPAAGPGRGPAEAEAAVLQANLPESVTERSLHALRRLAEVEAHIHGVPVSEVHFHELSAVDTLVDVVGAFVLWHELGEPRVVCGPVPMGSGRIKTAHGLMNAPAPATVELCRGLPIRGGEEGVEMTTPTGALLAGELAQDWGPLPAMRLAAVGYGAGHRDLGPLANVVRVLVGAEGQAAGFPVQIGPGAQEAPPRLEEMVMLETQVDDASGEKLAYLHQRLLQEGAADAWLRPITMKKGRPGTEVAVLVAPDKVDTVLDVIFRESGSLGVRRRSVERWSLARDFVEVEVYGRPVRVKRGWWRGRTVTVAPEYEDAAAAAAETGLSLDEVMSPPPAAARALG